MSKYLYKRSDGRSPYWHVRLNAPTEIHDLLPADEREIRKSTGTADKHKAKLVAARIEAKYRQEWEALRATKRDTASEGALQAIVLSESLVSQICGARLSIWQYNDDKARLEDGIDNEDLQEMEDFCAYSDSTMRSILAQGRHSPEWEHVIDRVEQWCEDLDYRVDPTDPLFPQLVRQFAATEKQVQHILQLRNQGEAVDFPKPELAKARLSAMVEAYTSHRQHNVGRKTFTTNLSIWQRFIDFSGDTPLDTVTSNSIYCFLEDRIQAEKKPWSQGYAHGRVKNALKEFFALARTLNLMSAPNPVLALEILPKLAPELVAKQNKPRSPYSTEQLSALFASDWYDPAATHWTGKMRDDLAARYWAPLISLHHGMRVREVVQLHSHDFRFEGALLMTVQEDLSGTESSHLPKRTLKNGSTTRTIPVHPTLIQLGFWDFLTAIQQQHPTGAPLFPSAIPYTDGKNPLWGRAYEQAFLRHVRDRLGFGKGLGNHSFRHTIEDKLKATYLQYGVWPPGLPQFYTGRKLPRDSDKDYVRLQSSEIDYGKGYDAANILDFVKQIAFEDVTFPPPFNSWLDGRSPVSPALLRASQRPSSPRFQSVSR